MLIRDGRVTEEDLVRIMERQASGGGRIGSLLVADGLVDAETLTVYLGLELGIPIATGATFERCKRSAVRLLAPAQAARFRAIPIVIQGQTLIVAVDDPHDMELLEEISEVTGYRVIPRVAPEIRIHYYLERFYGVPRPAQFASLGDQRGSKVLSKEHQGLPAPPLPGLPPRVEEPLEAPNPAPILQVVPSDAIPTHVEQVDTEEHEALELEAADLVEELEADKEEAAQSADATEETQAPVHTPPPPADLPRHSALTAAEAIEKISNTTQRGDIADAILGHATEIFEVAALLLVRNNIAYGWKGFGPDLDSDRIETLLMPLEASPMFQSFLHDDEPYRARTVHSTLHSHWFKILRTTAPYYSIVVGCSIGKRVVNLLYGQTKSGQDLRDKEMDALQEVMAAASSAYVRLISKSKG